MRRLDAAIDRASKHSMIWALTVLGARPTRRVGDSRTGRGDAKLRKPRSVDRALLVMFLLMLDGLRTGVDVQSGIFLTLWGVTYVVTVCGLIADRRAARDRLIGALPIVAVVTLCLCSVAWSDFGDIALKRAAQMVATTASAYVLVCRFKLKDFLECVALAGAIAALLSLIEVMLFPANGIMQDEYAGAWRGIFIHKNELGQGMVLAIVSMLVLALRRDATLRRRMMLGTMALVCAVTLAGSQSATSYLMLGVLATIVVAFVVARSPFGPIATGVLALVLTLVAFNHAAVVDALGRDTTLSGRTDLWQLVTEAIAKRPMFGYGYGTFWLPEGRASAYLPVLLDWSPYHAHNGLLELGLDIGLVGVAVFLLALSIMVWRSARVSMKPDIIWVWPLIAVLYFIFGNITEASIANYNDINWVTFVVAALYASGVRSRLGVASKSTAPMKSAAVRYAPLRPTAQPPTGPRTVLGTTRVPRYVAPSAQR